ncbi:MAG: hypothetical protein FJX72_04785 [Armatimonadetes bacterium]|nr:hypothetical protein [Armatimonadota bacterium]
MNDKKPVNPLVVVLMLVGIIGALGFTIWRALGPTEPAKPAVAKATETAAPAAERRTLASDAVAPGTNPFRGKQAVGFGTATAPTFPTIRTPVQPSPGPLPAPLLVSKDRAARAQALNAFTASDRAALRVPGMPTGSTQPMPVAVEPELVGTMVGARPTAVFKSDKTMVMVPQGGAYMGWRVVSVGHTEATVWNGGVTLKLRVGAPSAPVSRSASAPPEPQGYATANMIVVHYTGRPAPTRQDLVYGRIEDPVQYGAYDQADQPVEEPIADPDETPVALGSTSTGTEGEEPPPGE